jgi:Tfp pilus assembly protein PilN
VVDLNKEIKLSDLFRRGAKTPGEDVQAAHAAKKAEKERRSLFSRLPRERKEKAPKPPKEPKQPRGRRDRAPQAEDRPAVPLPEIPLMRAFNLMPGDEAREKKGSRAGLAQIAVALIGVLVFAGLAGGYLFTSAGVTSKQSELDDLRAQLAELDVPSETPGQEPSAAAADGQARTTALSTALASRIAWDRVLREVSLVIPADVWLTQLSASTPRATQGGAPATAAPPVAGSTAPNALAVVGFATSQENVALLLARLESIPELTSVQLQSSARSDGDDGQVYAFSILAGVDPLGVTAS